MARRCPGCGFTYKLHIVDGVALCGHCGAWFETEQEEGNMNIPWDEVRCPLCIRRDVQSESARIAVQCTLSLAADDSKRLRAILSDALASIIDTQWNCTTLERTEDSSGRERVVAIATCRVNEEQSGALFERLKKVSRPGLQLALEEIDTRPPAAQLDAVRAEMRREVYAAAQREVEALNQVLGAGEQPWQIGGIKIEEDAEDSGRRGQPFIPDRKFARTLVASLRADDDADLQVSTRLVTKAELTLKRPSVAPPQGGFFARPAS